MRKGKENRKALKLDIGLTKKIKLGEEVGETHLARKHLIQNSLSPLFHILYFGSTFGSWSHDK